MSRSGYHVGIAGATGLVGKEMLKVLEERNFPISKLSLWASEKSVGEELIYKGKPYFVQELSVQSFEVAKPDLVLFATSNELSRKFVPLSAEAGAIAIDNSSFFRMNPEVPLVVPEVNPEALDDLPARRIIANPNCTTAQLVVALKPLQMEVPMKRVEISSYQSVSGAGQDAIEELEKQVRDLFSNVEELEENVFPHQIAFNCIPHIDSFLENGFTKEEMKIIEETRKILNLPKLRITATAVRVPVFFSHSESVTIEFEEDFSPDLARQKLRTAPGIVLLDDPQKNLYPMATGASGSDEVYVGRIRKDESVPHGLHLWVVADNLRKGAATNAVQIAELCLDRGFFNK